MLRVRAGGPHPVVLFEACSVAATLLLTLSTWQSKTQLFPPYVEWLKSHYSHNTLLLRINFGRASCVQPPVLQGVLGGAAAGGSRGGGEWVVPVGFRWLGPGAPGSFGPMGLLSGARAYLPYAPASRRSGSANLLGRCVNPHPAFHHRVSSAPGFPHPRVPAGIQRGQAQAVRRCSGDPGESSEALPRPGPAPSDHSRYPRRPWESSLRRNSKTNV